MAERVVHLAGDIYEYRLSPARFPLPGAVVTPGYSEEVGLRAQETPWRAGRRVLDCAASKRILAAGQHQGSTSAIRTALNALAAN